jgi:hypothetical protein
MLKCTYEEIVTAAEGFITIAYVDIRQDNKTTVSGLVSMVWETFLESWRTMNINTDAARSD